MIDGPAFPPEQHPQSPVAVSRTSHRQPAEPAPQHYRRIAVGRIAVAAPGHPEGPTRSPFAHLMDLLEVADQYAPRGGP